MFKLMVNAMVFLALAGLCLGEVCSITGKLCMVGNEPLTRLVCQTDDQQYFLVGDLVAELKNLQGLTVRLTGEKITPVINNTRTGFKVTGYELLSDSYQKKVNSWVGLIKKNKQGQLYLELSSGVQYRLAGELLPELKKHSSAKVWVTGRLMRSWFWGEYILNVTEFRSIKQET